MNTTLNKKLIFDHVADDSQTFPKNAIEKLQELNMMAFSTFSENLFSHLFQVGKADLSVGRIYEGHVNALLLIDLYGTSAQREHYFREAEEGKLFGVWNTETPEEQLKINDFTIDGYHILEGSKTFCSGALNIDRPIVTARTAKGVQMLILDLDINHNLEEDWSQWDPIGMKPSVSCRIDFTTFQINKTNFLGKLNDYYKEPMFTWGAVRFSAVQLGGAQKIAEIMLRHLQVTKRSDDPYQKMRIGKIGVLMQTGKLWMEQAGKIESSLNYDHNQKINFANMMRTLTLQICEETIALAEKAVGIQGILKNHPLERPVRDLRVYLKQAGPDYALTQVGSYYDNKNYHD